MRSYKDLKAEKARFTEMAAKFLQIVQEFGYPDLTMEVLAKDAFYQQVGRNLLNGELHPKVINDIVDFIKKNPKG